MSAVTSGTGIEAATDTVATPRAATNVAALGGHVTLEEGPGGLFLPDVDELEEGRERRVAVIDEQVLQLDRQNAALREFSRTCLGVT